MLLPLLFVATGREFTEGAAEFVAAEAFMSAAELAAGAELAAAAEFAEPELFAAGAATELFATDPEFATLGVTFSNPV